MLKVVKRGNSLAIILPSKMVKAMGIKEGDLLAFDFREAPMFRRDEALES
jgi:antitoxin component of MazEF toxin-antitoxin module